MANNYDSNGDYESYGGDFKRKSGGPEGEAEESNPAAQKAGEYVRELLGEKLSIDQSKHPNASRLIDQGILDLVEY